MEPDRGWARSPPRIVRLGERGMDYEVSLATVTYALSDALDLVGVDVVQHGKRVAYVALELARHMAWPREDLEELFFASLLHDCGVSSTETHHRLVETFDCEGMGSHCERGYGLLMGFEPFQGVAQIVRLHHTPWSRFPLLGTEPRLARISNCVFLADRVDAGTQQRPSPDLLMARGDILARLKAAGPDYFAPELLESLDTIAARESFWLTLEARHLERYLDRVLARASSRAISLPQLRQLAQIFAQIVDFKSPFTEEHSQGVARLSKLMGQLCGLSPVECDRLEVAGLLHDLGKLRVPDSILTKPSRLNDEEFSMVARHPFETYQILSRIEGLHDLAEWAAYHHESPAGDGYPFHLDGSQMVLPARIVAVADVYQSFAQDRPYRQGLSAQKIVDLLRGFAEKGKLDARLVEVVAANSESCWEAAQGEPARP